MREGSFIFITGNTSVKRNRLFSVFNTCRTQDQISFKYLNFINNSTN